MKQTTLIILAETCHNLVERFTPLIEEVRLNLGEIKIIGIFAGFELGARQIKYDDLFDEAHFIARSGSALQLIESIPHSLFITFINHNATFRDSQLYAVAQRSSQRKAFVLRNRISLHKYLTAGVDDGSEIRAKIINARREQATIYIKAFFLVLLSAAIIYPGRLFSYLFSSRRGPKKRILFIKLDVLGDMIVALPYIAALRESFIDAELTVLASSRGAAIVKEQSPLHEHGLYDQLTVWDAPWHTNFPKVPGFAAVWQLLRQLPSFWKQQYDIVIQSVNLGTGIVFAVLTLAKQVVAVIDSRLPLAVWIRPFVRNSVDVCQDRIPHLEDFTGLVLSRIGVKKDFAAPGLLISEQSRIKVKRFLGDHGYVENRKLVLFNIGAGHPLRVWGVQKFAQLAEKVGACHDVMIVLTGSKDERAMASEIVSLSVFPVLNSAGLFSLNELIALTSMADLMVTVDTGIMHLAAAVNTPLVAIFGAGLVDYCKPLSRNHVIVKEELGCSGCADRCFVSHSPPCLERVTVSRVFGSLEVLLTTTV